MGKAGHYHHSGKDSQVYLDHQNYAGYYPPPDLNAEADEAFWKDRLCCSCDTCKSILWVEILNKYDPDRFIRYRYFKTQQSVTVITHCYHCNDELGDYISYRDGVLTIKPADLLPPIDTTEEKIFIERRTD